MKKFRKIIVAMSFCVICLVTVIPANAATNQFSGTLNYRLLDGSNNGKYYTITANKKLTMSGNVTCDTCSDAKASVNTTYIKCFEGSASGRGTIICSSTVKVGLHESKSFEASGTPKKTKCYMYIFKTEDDGYNLSIGGTLSQ